MGVEPNLTLDDFPWMPKQRYKIMKEYMKRVGTLGQQIRFNSELVVGSCLYFEEKMIHFSGFLKDQVNIPQYKSKVA